MKMKKLLAVVLSVVTAAGMVGGCSQNKETAADGQVVIRVGGWPLETDEKAYAAKMEIKEEFEKTYPDIKIVPDEWGFDLDTFLPKAVSGQLPDIYITSFTEIKRIIQSGYACDISEYMEKYKYTEYLRDDIIDLISDENGGIYAVPKSSYAMGLMINMNLFTQAGLVNDDGTPMVPKTWEDVTKFSKIIKEKTGKPGFGMSTMNNVGGWHFLNLAWGYGTNKEFVRQENGKWIADFATPECIEALQFVKDLRWVHGATPDNALLDFDEMYKMFATDQLAMIIASPPLNALFDQYGMTNTDAAAVKMPAGPAGRFAQIGGEIQVMKNGLTDEQIDACFKWLEFNGVTPEVSEERKKNIDTEYRIQNEKGYVVGIRKYSMWKADNVPPVRQYEEECIDKYTNVNPVLWKDYADFGEVTVVPEPPISCQQLYSLLDGCIQSVFADENADPKSLLEEAANNYQVNYLDKEK